MVRVAVVAVVVVVVVVVAMVSCDLLAAAIADHARCNQPSSIDDII